MLKHHALLDFSSALGLPILFRLERCGTLHSSYNLKFQPTKPFAGSVSPRHCQTIAGRRKHRLNVLLPRRVTARPSLNTPAFQTACVHACSGPSTAFPTSHSPTWFPLPPPRTVRTLKKAWSMAEPVVKCAAQCNGVPRPQVSIIEQFPARRRVFQCKIHVPIHNSPIGGQIAARDADRYAPQPRTKSAGMPEVLPVLPFVPITSPASVAPDAWY